MLALLSIPRRSLDGPCCRPEADVANEAIRSTWEDIDGLVRLMSLQMTEICQTPLRWWRSHMVSDGPATLEQYEAEFSRRE